MAHVVALMAMDTVANNEALPLIVGAMMSHLRTVVVDMRVAHRPEHDPDEAMGTPLGLPSMGFASDARGWPFSDGVFVVPRHPDILAMDTAMGVRAAMGKCGEFTEFAELLEALVKRHAAELVLVRVSPPTSTLSKVVLLACHHVVMLASNAAVPVALELSDTLVGSELEWALREAQDSPGPNRVAGSLETLRREWELPFRGLSLAGWLFTDSADTDTPTKDLFAAMARVGQRMAQYWPSSLGVNRCLGRLPIPDPARSNVNYTATTNAMGRLAAELNAHLRANQQQLDTLLDD